MYSAYRKNATLSALPPSSLSAAQQPRRNPTLADTFISAAMPGSTASRIRDSIVPPTTEDDNVSPLERALAARKAAKAAEKAAKAEAKKAKKDSKTAAVPPSLGHGDAADDGASTMSKSSSVAWLLR